MDMSATLLDPGQAAARLVLSATDAWRGALSMIVQQYAFASARANQKLTTRQIQLRSPAPGAAAPSRS